MIQAAMIFALGALVAGLLALLVTPAIWRRAMRLARTRIEAKVPLSRAEIDADKDQLRAGFAVTNRRLEIETGQLRERVAEGSIAFSRRSDEVTSLTREKVGLVAAIASLEGRIAEISGSLAETSDRLTGMTGEVASRDGRLAEQETALAGMRSQLGSAQLMTEELRLEMVARQTEIGNLSDSLRERSAAELAAASARDQLANDLAEEGQRLAAESSRLATLQASLDALQTDRTSQIAELELLAAELARRTAEAGTFEAAMATAVATRQALAADVENVRADRARLAVELSERSKDIARLTNELNQVVRLRNELHGQVEASTASAVERRDEAAGDNLRKALSATAAEKDELALRLAALEDDIDALRAENTELRGVAGAEWESEREDSRRLRERLNEIAAGVVRLTQTLDSKGGNSPTEEIGGTRPIPLASVQRPVAASPPSEPGDSTLAERLRALQHAARH